MPQRHPDRDHVADRQSDAEPNRHRYSHHFPVPHGCLYADSRIVSQPVDELCLTLWTFIQPPPQGCPLAPATVGQGVYQTFERGHMIWVGAWDVIYVMFLDGATPYWRRYPDTFDEAIHPWDAPELDSPPSRPPNTWQPRRGFGKLWREAPPEDILNRVGCGTIEKEVPYSVKVQTRSDGTHKK